MRNKKRKHTIRNQLTKVSKCVTTEQSKVLIKTMCATLSARFNEPEIGAFIQKRLLTEGPHNRPFYPGCMELYLGYNPCSQPTERYNQTLKGNKIVGIRPVQLTSGKWPKILERGVPAVAATDASKIHRAQLERLLADLEFKGRVFSAKHIALLAVMSEDVDCELVTSEAPETC